MTLTGMKLAGTTTYLGLSELVVVMREAQVDATRVDIHVLAEHVPV